MSLLAYAPPTAVVPLSEDQDMTVRGLSLTDIVQIFQKYAAELETVFKARMELATETGLDMQSSLILLLETAPKVAAELIAMGDTEVPEDRLAEAATIAGTLSATAQLVALTEITRLTLHSEEEVEKLLGMLTQGTNVFTRLVGIVNEQRPQQH